MTKVVNRLRKTVSFIDIIIFNMFIFQCFIVLKWQTYPYESEKIHILILNICKSYIQSAVSPRSGRYKSSINLIKCLHTISYVGSYVHSVLWNDFTDVLHPLLSVSYIHLQLEPHTLVCSLKYLHAPMFVLAALIDRYWIFLLLSPPFHALILLS